jgi:holo-[acyl-carrier protein] synthase
MIVGLGIDLVEISRIEEAMENPRFLERILTVKEREYCITPFHVAGRWAAKEAVAKAVGLALSWQEVEVLPDELGVPKALVTSVHFDPIRFRVHVSITHERSHAAAVAILERLVYQVTSS